MEDATVRLRNDLMTLLQNELFPVHDENRYYRDCELRPRYVDDELLALEDVSFLWRSSEAGGMRTNDVLADSRLGFDFHLDALDARAARLTSRLSSFSIRLRLSDLSTPDVVQWERYKRDSRYTGRLKVDDTAELQTDVRAANALVSGVEYLLFERLPEHEARSESAELGPQLREVWTDDHEILRRLRRR
jgi:hypothetical protein